MTRLTRFSFVPARHTTYFDLWRPAWARRTHPVVARQMAALPAFDLYAWGGSRRLMVALLALLAPCALLTGSLPLQLVLLPLGWLPVLWAAPLVSRERRQGTWDLLCLTPYPRAELLLASGWAVACRLRGLLGWLLIGQVASVVNVLLYMAFFLGGGGYRTLSGAYVHLAELPPAAGTLPAFVGIALLALLAVPLDFGLSIGLGLLASARMARREGALLVACGLRALASLLALVTGVIALITLTGQALHPVIVFGAQLVIGPVGWPLIGVLQYPGAAFAAVLVIVGMLALLLFLTLDAIRRVARDG